MSTATARTSLKPRLVATGVLCLCLAVAACGRKGPLEPPPDVPPEMVRVPSNKPTPPPPGTKPDKPFFLDRLLM